MNVLHQRRVFWNRNLSCVLLVPLHQNPRYGATPKKELHQHASEKEEFHHLNRAVGVPHRKEALEFHAAADKSRSFLWKLPNVKNFHKITSQVFLKTRPSRRQQPHVHRK